MLELLDTYELPLLIQRQTVERIFTENGSILALFTGVIISKEFDLYFEKIIGDAEKELKRVKDESMKCLKAGEEIRLSKEEAILLPIEMTDEIRSSVREMLISTAQVGLYLKAVQEIALAGEGDLVSQICKLINFKNIKGVLRPIRFKKQIRQMLIACS